MSPLLVAHGPNICDCDHDCLAPVDEELSRENVPDVNPIALDPMAKFLEALTDKITASKEPTAQRSSLKVTTTIEFPKGSDVALESLDAWFREFDKVIDHIGIRSAKDRIVHLLAAWPNDTIVGENLQLDMEEREYQK